MSTEVVRVSFADNIELEKKKLELVKLENELIDYQDQLVMLKAQTHSFQDKYLKTVGVLYAELDGVRAEIAELLSVLNPVDAEAQRKATFFRAHAEDTAREASQAREQAPKPEIYTTENLKKLFRDAAKCIHPDLAGDESERIHRHQVMSRVNSAYADGDETALRTILEEWKESHSSKDDSVREKLVKVEQKMIRIQQSIHRTKAEIKNLQASDIGVLLIKFNKSNLQNRDLLLDMAVSIRAEIVHERKKLSTLLNEKEKQ